MGRIFVYVVAILIFLNLSPYAEDLSVVFKKANIYYDKNRLDSAKIYYKKVLQDRKIVPIVFNNLGNVYFKQDSIAKSIYYYEKAFKYNPYLSVTEENLKNIYQNRFNENIIEKDVYYILKKIFNVKIYNLFSMIIIALLILSLILFVIKKRKNSKKSVVIILINYILLFIILLYALVATYFEHQFNYGIVKTGVNLMSEPSYGKVLGTLDSGVRVRVLKKDGKHVFVNINGKMTGWLVESELLQI